MVRPVTNCSPIIRMATSTPARMIGSPERGDRAASARAERLCSLSVATSLPVSTRPQVAALTNSDGLCPTWARQSPAPSLSRISASRVAASGMRSSASARHISATPSWLESEYSWMSPSTPLERERDFSRSFTASPVAISRMRSASSGAAAASSISAADAFRLAAAMVGGDGGAQALGARDVGAEGGEQGRGVQRGSPLRRPESLPPSLRRRQGRPFAVPLFARFTRSIWSAQRGSPHEGDDRHRLHALGGAPVFRPARRAADAAGHSRRDGEADARRDGEIRAGERAADLVLDGSAGRGSLRAHAVGPDDDAWRGGSKPK